MQAALENPSCDSSNPAMAFGNNVKACPPLAPYVQETPSAACKLAGTVPLNEDMGMGHPLPALPGCNPITAKDTPPCEGPISPSKAKSPRYLIKSKLNNKYLSSNPPGTKNPITASVTIPTLTEVWDPNPVNGGVCLMSEDDGSFASASGENGSISCNRGSVSDWETFKIVPQNNGYVGIQANKNNKFLNVTSNGLIIPACDSPNEDSCLFMLEIPTGGMLKV